MAANRVQPAPGQTDDRDPNHLNDHLKIDFYSVMGEPDELRSIDCVWEFSEVFYDCCRNMCYGLSTLCCGICIAMQWGIDFAPTVFTSVWCLTPCNALLYNVCTLWCKTCCTICTRCAIAPMCKSFAHLFRHCGDGDLRRSETPDIFPKSIRRPRPPPESKPEVMVEEPETKVVPVPVPVRGAGNDYDKDKVVKSVKRQMMLY